MFTFGPMIAKNARSGRLLGGAPIAVTTLDGVTLDTYTVDGQSLTLVTNHEGYHGTFRADTDQRVILARPRGGDPLPLYAHEGIQDAAEAADTINTGRLSETALSSTIAAEADAPARAAAVDELSRVPEVADAAATRAVSVAADPAVAALVTPETATGAALEAEFGPAPVAAEKIIYVSARGHDSNDGSSLKRAKATLAAAIAEAGDASARIELAAGSFDMGPGIQVRSQVSIVGQGAHTVLNYTGTGAAIGSATPTARTYRQRFRNLRLNGPGQNVADSVGLDLESMSEVAIENVTITGFAVGAHLHSGIAGGSVYARAWNLTVQNCATGVLIDSGSNATTLIASRTSSCGTGIHVRDANNVSVIASQIETNTTGVLVEGSAVSRADQGVIAYTRFEDNGTAWNITSSNVRYWKIVDALRFGTYTYIDNGLSTSSSASPTDPVRYSTHSNDSGGAWVFKRTQHGGDYAPAHVVRDTNTSFGAPVQYQAESGRGTGMFYRGVRAGTVYFEVNAWGAVGSGAGPTAQRPPASTLRPGSLWYDTTLEKPIWWNGTAWTDAMGAAV